MFACRSLIQSDLGNEIEWVLLDSTSPSVPPPSFWNRLIRAFIRLWKFVFLVLFRQPESILIFTADGFSFLEKGLMALIGKLFGKKVIIAPRSGYIPRDLKESRVLKRFIPFVLKKVDYVICQGASWRALFLPLLGERNRNKLVIVENWMDTSITCDHSIKVNNETIQVLFLGWLEKSKGVFDLLEASLNILAKKDNVEFVFAGDGSARSELISRTKEENLSNKIKFPGWVDGEKKKELICGSDIFVLPSYFEGFPNSLMEAMLAANACIATTVGSIPDVIRDGKNGYLMDKGDVGRLVEILTMLIDDRELRLKIGESGRAKVLLSHSIGNAEKKFSKIL